MYRQTAFPLKLISKTFCLLLIIFSQSYFAQTTAEITMLESDKPIEREIAAKEKHNYKITLAENQYAFLIVEQRGIDVAVRVFDKTNERLAQRDLISKTEGREELGFTASTAGVYRLEIEGKTTSSPTGRYTVLLAEVRPPTEKELRLEEARKLHGKSLDLWRAGKFAEALTASERSLEIRQKESGAEDFEVAASLANVALIVLETGDYEKGIALIQRALEIREKIFGPDHLELAVSLANLGTAYRVLGDYEKAERFLRRSLEIKEKNLPPNDASIASSLSNLADIYLYKGDADKALEFEMQALSIREKTSGLEHPSVANSLSGIGNAIVKKAIINQRKSIISGH